MTKNEALKLALEALEEHYYGVAQIIIREALAVPEQEPVAWMCADESLKKKHWVGLTDEELPPLVGDNGKYMELQQVRRFYKYIEAKLKEKNT